MVEISGVPDKNTATIHAWGLNSTKTAMRMINEEKYYKNAKNMVKESNAMEKIPS